MSSSKQQDVDYEKRVVLFLDFLGFREVIKATENDPKKVADVIEAIDTLRSIGNQQEFFKSQRMTQFSDCVVVSYRCDERSAAFDLVSEIGFALVRLVELGFLVRGGVAVGDLIHTEHYLFGPAMIEAYELESKCAIYPRVLVSNRLLDVAISAPAEHHHGHEERKYVAGYLCKDTDGCHYIDYVSWNAVVNVIGGENELYGDYLEKISKILKHGFAAKAPDVRLKYGWLHERYAAAVEAIASLPPESAWVRENFEMYEGIKELPMQF
jgi:hypothetical protein